MTLYWGQEKLCINHIAGYSPLQFLSEKKKKINYDENVNAQVAESYQISRSNIKIMVWDSHSSACDESLQLQGQVAGLLP